MYIVCTMENSSVGNAESNNTNSSNLNNCSPSNCSPSNCSPSNCRIKRDRGKNFLPIEREQLLQICSEYYDIIENKKTDSMSCKKKYEAWLEITKKFNAIQTTGVRNDKHLKTLYDNIKRDAKRPKSGDKLQIYSPGHYVGNATSLCSVLINESGIDNEPKDNFEPSPASFNGDSNVFDSKNERINIKDEPNEVESEAVQPLSNSFSSKDSYTSDYNYTTHLESLLMKKENRSNTPEVCKLPPSLSEETDNAEEYHKTRLRYLEIEHQKKMELLDLEQECLMIKREYLIAKLRTVNKIQNENSNETNNN